MSRKMAIYARVSTADRQTVDNQRAALEEWAKKAAHEVVAVYEDKGISGTKGRDQRPAFDQMLKDAVRREFDLIAAWHVDRLGRSLQDLVGFLAEIHSAGVDLFIHQQAVDTTTPAGKAMFGMLGVFAEFERSMIQARVKAGLERAKANGKKLGRPKIDAKKERNIRKLLAEGHGMLKVAKLAGVGSGTVQRVKAEIAEVR